MDYTGGTVKALGPSLGSAEDTERTRPEHYPQGLQMGGNEEPDFSISETFFLLTSTDQHGGKLLKGEECVPHSQPWQVALYKRGRFNCSASLISPNWVLSAAHCCSMRVRLGEHNLHKRDGPEQLRAVSQVIPHAQYEVCNHHHDIMLLQLARPACLTSQVYPVALPTHCPHPGKACVVSNNETRTTGSPKSQVSLPDTLHCANISIISDTSCDKDYPGHLMNTMVCAGAEDGGTDSCEGDSGGPLVCRGVMQGIVSWGDVPCDNTTKPGVFTKVCHYLEWIGEVMERN
ncbi:kallikrein-15 [Nycticebus coucang]|uniref:kallikrein-15 n=1 Tax=Nycticebus coucang TaxID=9470 RepID=UPI00234C8F84|nr:kallikrein-15 [Nycticebus coucang]